MKKIIALFKKLLGISKPKPVVTKVKEEVKQPVAETPVEEAPKAPKKKKKYYQPKAK